MYILEYTKKGEKITREYNRLTCAFNQVLLSKAVGVASFKLKKEPCRHISYALINYALKKCRECGHIKDDR